MMQWITDHQALLLMAWPVATALFSLLYTQFEALPRVHAVLSALASLGIDLPTLWDALGRFISKKPPSAGGGAKPSPDTVQRGQSIPVSLQPPASKRVAGWPMWWAGPIVVLALAFVPAVAMTGCTPAQTAELQNIENVVMADLSNGKTLQQIEDDVATIAVGKVGPALVAIVDDALAFLIDSGLVPASILPTAQKYHSLTSASRHP